MSLLDDAPEEIGNAETASGNEPQQPPVSDKASEEPPRPSNGCSECGSTRRHKKDCSRAGAGRAPSTGKRKVASNDSAPATALTKENVNELFGAMFLSLSMLDSPVWKLNPDELKLLSGAWYPVLKRYEDDLTEWLQYALLLVPTVSVLGPRVMLRMQIASGNITNEQAAAVIGPLSKGVAAAMKGETVTIKLDEQTGGDNASPSGP